MTNPIVEFAPRKKTEIIARQIGQVLAKALRHRESLENHDLAEPIQFQLRDSRLNSYTRRGPLDVTYNDTHRPSNAELASQLEEAQDEFYGLQRDQEYRRIKALAANRPWEGELKVSKNGNELLSLKSTTEPGKPQTIIVTANGTKITLEQGKRGNWQLKLQPGQTFDEKILKALEYAAKLGGEAGAGVDINLDYLQREGIEWLDIGTSFFTN